jgi:predicted aconitase
MAALQASAASRQKAAELLQQRGINPEQLSEEQMNDFATSTISVQSQSIEHLLQNLNILTPDDLLRRCHALLEELKIFADLCERKKNHAEYRQRVEYAHFRGDVRKEVELMHKVRFPGHKDHL